jgi:hypothetical protein
MLTCLTMTNDLSRLSAQQRTGHNAVIGFMLLSLFCAIDR